MVLFQIKNDSSVPEHFTSGKAAEAAIAKAHQVLFLANVI